MKVNPSGGVGGISLEYYIVYTPALLMTPNKYYS